MNSLKSIYGRFTRWQLRHRNYVISDKQVECLNCGNTYQGNFCPYCGQSSHVKRFTWHGVFTGAMDVWGLGGRSLLRNVKHLLLRPGFMIADYLHGRRQLYFSPFKMLFLMVALLLLVRNLGHITDNLVDEETMSGKKDTHIALIVDFLDKNRVVFMLLLALLMGVLMKMFFGHSKRMGRINMCECIYTQVWVVNQMLIIQVLATIFNLLTGLFYGGSLVLYVLYWIVDYKQLFGMGWWSTTWRTLLLALITLAVTTAMVIILGLMVKG